MIESIWRELSPAETPVPDPEVAEPMSQSRFKAVRRLWG
jgi:hypothetical protein